MCNPLAEHNKTGVLDRLETLSAESATVGCQASNGKQSEGPIKDAWHPALGRAPLPPPTPNTTTTRDSVAKAKTPLQLSDPSINGSKAHT